MNKLGRVLALFLTGLFCSSNAMDLRRITFQDGKGGFHEVEKGSFVLNMIARHSTPIREVLADFADNDTLPLPITHAQYRLLEGNLRALEAGHRDREALFENFYQQGNVADYCAVLSAAGNVGIDSLMNAHSIVLARILRSLVQLTTKMEWDLLAGLLECNFVDFDFAGVAGRAMLCASQKGDTDLVKKLLDRGCSPYTLYPSLSLPIERYRLNSIVEGFPSIADWIKEQIVFDGYAGPPQTTALIEASRNGQHHIVELFLNDLKERMRSLTHKTELVSNFLYASMAFMSAVKGGHIGIVHSFLNAFPCYAE